MGWAGPEAVPGPDAGRPAPLAVPPGTYRALAQPLGADRSPTDEPLVSAEAAVHANGTGVTGTPR
ncbi:MAG TPA: hypothetical protein VI248_20515 [Kineosporiaceae bacterium]